MKTDATEKPVNKPNEDGTCAPGRSLCGTGNFATCLDLQNDPQH